MDEKSTQNGLAANTRYAGFWVRLAALIIDALIRMALFIIIYIVTYIPLRIVSDMLGIIGIIIVIVAILILSLGYDTYFITRPDGATPGKQMLGIRVVDENGKYPIPLGKALLREAVVKIFLARLTFGILTIISIILLITDSKKRAVHDRIAKTYVIYK